MKESGDLQDSSSLFYSVLLCFSESLMNTDRLEMEHVCLLVGSLHCSSVGSYSHVIKSTCTFYSCFLFTPLN